MIVKNIHDTIMVACPNGGFISNRYLTKNDNMGFTITRTLIPVNGKQYWHYKNHLEACLCIKGKGILIDNITKKEYEILPYTMYALNNNDPHTFEAIEETILICVFNPALNGYEIHNSEGTYE
jgi:L-ectoine synthase